VYSSASAKGSSQEYWPQYFTRLGVHTRLEAIALARKEHLVSTSRTELSAGARFAFSEPSQWLTAQGIREDHALEAKYPSAEAHS
jgi:hypothetical protein